MILADSEEYVALAQSEIAEAEDTQSVLEAEADISGSLEEADSVGAAEETSQSLTEADSVGAAESDSHTEVTFPLSLALGTGSKGTCPVGVGGTHTV